MLDLLVATKLDSDDGQEGFRINGDLAGSGTDKTYETSATRSLMSH
jgi:hypothetical protein